MAAHLSRGDLGLSRIVLGAHALHSGGGAVLLRALLPAIAPHLASAFVDARFAAEAQRIVPGVPLTAVAPGMGARVAALLAIAGAADADDRLFAFNNVPPLRRSAAKTIVFVHTLFHFGGRGPRVAWNAHDRARLFAEQALFVLGRANVDEYWVQTPTMADSLARVALGRAVRVMPLYGDAPCPPDAATAPPSATAPAAFFYPAQGWPFKNHRTLYRAWALLADDGAPARLEVTLPAAVHALRLHEANARDLPAICNLGELDAAQTDARLRAADALIFPSLAESFGLPLVEAAALGKPIVAAERSHVRDVCVPAETFDPQDPRSIADAVRRFMRSPRPPVRPISANEFVQAILA